MLFVINGLKYNTEKMRKIATVKKWYSFNSIFLKDMGRTYDCELWKSEKGNWLLTHEEDYCRKVGEAIEEQEAKELLLKYEISAYEALYGEVEEA